jgi:DNA-binding transcriptional ArsR family regulator
MPRLTLSAPDVAGLRLAFSPLWEVVASVRVLKEPGAHALHLPWIKAATTRLATTDVDLLWSLVPVPTRRLPGFLAPTPATPLPELDDELDELVAVTVDDLRAELIAVLGRSGAQTALYRAPKREMRRLVGQIRAYWDAVLVDDWPRLRGLLEGDVMYRARRLARGGARLLFADLHPDVSWERDTLTVRIPGATAEHALDGRGLVLVPSAFVWPRVFCKVDRRWPPVLRYPPRGVATLWESGTRAVDGLDGVLGRTRARLLAELDSPASTSELARRTGLTAAAVSQHLALLRDAGLVSAHRTGPVVLYGRTRRADGLIQ